VSITIRIFGIGSHVAELGVDLKERSDGGPLVESLNRHFGNLRSVAGDGSASLIGPVVERFCEELHAVAEARPDIQAKCADLERELREFAVRLGEEEPWDDDIPF
jgi:hypothetical protein